jgi:cation diffusion facilitator family transporter
MKTITLSRASLTRFAWLSIAASIVIIALKTYAWWLTGSVGLLSDALESVVNLAAACVALVALTIAARPADADHPYGHDKAEYFASGVEGGLILIAALGIGIAAVDRLFHPQPLERIGLGILISLAASLINLGVARVLLAAGQRHNSIVLEADARHLLTDVWTSVGVVVGVGAVAVTGALWLDPVVALAVAANIVWTGVDLVRRSVRGLMDTALPAREQEAIREVLDGFRAHGIEYHALRTRVAASRRFISVHILVPGAWSVQRGHDVVERIELELAERLEHATIFTHLEPLEDPASWEDDDLSPTRERRSLPPQAGESERGTVRAEPPEVRARDSGRK